MEPVDARREVRDANAGHGLLPLSRAQGMVDGRPSRPCAAHGLAGIAGSSYRTGMCRSIKTLRRADEAATTGELEAAARQYVRKISGYRTPIGAQHGSVRGRDRRDRRGVRPAPRGDRRVRRGGSEPLDAGPAPRARQRLIALGPRSSGPVAQPPARHPLDLDPDQRTVLEAMRLVLRVLLTERRDDVAMPGSGRIVETAVASQRSQASRDQSSSQRSTRTVTLGSARMSRMRASASGSVPRFGLSSSGEYRTGSPPASTKQIGTSRGRPSGAIVPSTARRAVARNVRSSSDSTPPSWHPSPARPRAGRAATVGAAPRARRHEGEAPYTRPRCHVDGSCCWEEVS